MLSNVALRSFRNFAAYLKRACTGVVTFCNRGGDAPGGRRVRRWRPPWATNRSGSAQPWGGCNLRHVRLDDRPDNHGHAPCRQAC